MADHQDDRLDRDSLDDNKEKRQRQDSLSEETAAAGQRAKGAGKEALGDVADDRGMEEEGRRENQAGRERQKRNDAV